mgnify:CR=1 FL=1|jgi:hypothetical protein
MRDFEFIRGFPGFRQNDVAAARSLPSSRTVARTVVTLTPSNYLARSETLHLRGGLSNFQTFKLGTGPRLKLSNFQTFQLSSFHAFKAGSTVSV